MQITNWFTVAAGVCFALATVYAIMHGHDFRLIVMNGLLAGVNFILGTL